MVWRGEEGVHQMSTSPVLQPLECGYKHTTSSILIRKAAVLGAGTMGSRIAAHLANAGLPVVLLDIAATSPRRSSIAGQAVEALKKGKPAAFYDPSTAARITVGNFEDD